MATFPLLKTGAAAQYPLEMGWQSASEEVRFLDGSRQTYLLHRAPMRRWYLQFDLLDEVEVSQLSQFVEANKYLPFAFPDPISGTTIPACRFHGAAVIVDSKTEGSAAVSLVVEEIV